MWAGVGNYVPAVGPCGVIIALIVPTIAVLGTVLIICLVSKSRIPEGDVRIRVLGIRVRWGQSTEVKTGSDSDRLVENIDNGDGKQTYRLRNARRDQQT